MIIGDFAGGGKRGGARNRSARRRLPLRFAIIYATLGAIVLLILYIHMPA